MLWVALRETLYFLFWPSKGKISQVKGFNSWLRLANWLILIFVLYVSVPHSVNVLMIHEHNEANSISLALTIELVPAVAFLAAMHLESLNIWWRLLLIGLSTPFIVLTFFIQLAAFGGVDRHPISTEMLAATLPYGVIVTSIGIAVITNHIIGHRDEIAIRVEQARKEGVEETEARYQVIFEQQEQQMTNQNQQIGELEDRLNVAHQLLSQPDEERSQLVSNLDATRQELEEAKSLLETSRKQHEATQKLLEAKQNSPVLELGQIIINRTERDGLEQHIRSLEKALEAYRVRASFPRDEVTDIFRRLNPRVAEGRLDQAGAKALLEELWLSAAQPQIETGAIGISNNGSRVGTAVIDYLQQGQ